MEEEESNASSDHGEVHVPSSSSDEDWGDGIWEVDGIIGEHTATRGEHRYQIAWGGWTRPDGSNWTWESEEGTTMQDIPRMLKQWRKEKSLESRRKAIRPFVSPFHPYELPENEENEDDQNDTKSKKKLPVTYAFTEQTHQAHQMAIDLIDNVETSRSLTTAFERLQKMRTKREADLKSSEVSLQEAVAQCLHGFGPATQMEGRYRAPKKMSLARRMETLHVFNPTLKKLTNGLNKNARVLRSTCTDVALHRQSSIMNAREFLQKKWSAATQAAGAASVIFVNDFDDEALPALDVAKFVYLESEYIYGPSVTRSQDEFMESCDCSSICTAALCSCQDDSEIQDDGSDAKEFAYTADRLFTFSESIMSYVIECNKNCLCDARCRSRVAQQPRDFPIEVFRTERCGWGVRAIDPLPRGRVLGVYTGELLSREAAKMFSVKRASYLFDLDFMDTGPHDGYSVDAYTCGNWTRFVNHSCNPVCALYPVIWDSVPSMHQPKLAFVAKTDIPARTELTIDYCPQAQKGKGRARSKMPGTPDCMCDAEYCRGFIYLE
ncbi:SET domain-containing protein [Ramaria rubella]|nr:SET domain-containing protein [Ramaria rubella]